MSTPDPSSPSTADLNIQFFSACLPPLEDGDYKVTVSQKLSNLGPGHPNETLPDTHLGFTVAGPRFSLDPTDVHIVYPPSYKQLTFQGQLPHIVFSRKTLPWERLIGRDASPNEAIPWLALILIHDTDFGGSPLEATPLITGTVKDLLQPPAGILGPQNIHLDFGESLDDPVQYVDLPVDLYQDILPKFDELKWMAHARDVETKNKPTNGSSNNDGVFSVLVGNRLPHESAKNTALTVSVEGFESYLPGNQLPQGTHFVRMAVLHSWQFFMGGEDPFDALMRKQNTGLLALKSPNIVGNASVNVSPPTAQPGDSPDDFARQEIEYALYSGYAPLTHDLREGGKTVSWFRGPLIPPNIPLQQPSGGGFATFDFADQSLLYSPKTGIFDTTYSGAWQLGRLLALQSQAFANALRTYVQQVFQAAHQTVNQSAISEYFGSVEQATPSSNDSIFWGHTLTKILAPNPDRPNPEHKRVPCTQAQEAANGIKAAATQRAVPSPLFDYYSNSSNLQAFLESAPTPNDQIITWLSEIAMLYGVPFEYIVPNAQMLPMESIRYAYLDENWVARLLDGALSIGLVSNSIIQKLLFQALTYTVIKPAVSTRVPTQLASNSVPPLDSSSPPEQYKLNWPLSTFLIRSSIIGAWKGIEVLAKDVSGSPEELLPHLRLEIIAPNTLLAIYNGRPDSLTFRHPSENFHFGIDGFEDIPYDLKQDLRDLNTGLAFDPVQKVDVCLRSPYSPQSDLGSGVINITATADSIRKGLINAGQLSASDPLTVSDFAIQMVESPKEVTFSFSYS